MSLPLHSEKLGEGRQGMPIRLIRRRASMKGNLSFTMPGSLRAGAEATFYWPESRPTRACVPECTCGLEWIGTWHILGVSVAELDMTACGENGEGCFGDCDRYREAGESYGVAKET
ncbi:MAG: hypothetical protein DMG72_24805 [Acidobacteria bacterium]|nr:MAG: hypothetical protein DMG72_24805 [Acidobacteriota bacterium]